MKDSLPPSFQVSGNLLPRERNVRVHVAKIRCFSDPQAVRLGRITVLVGENSTGKSTFLAVNSMLSHLLRPSAIDFNREPFILGSYRDIATLESKGANNSPSFTIGIEGEILPKPCSYLFEPDVDDSVKHSKRYEKYKVLTTFVDRSGQPIASQTEISIGSYCIKIDWPVSSPKTIRSISSGSNTIDLSADFLDDWSYPEPWRHYPISWSADIEHPIDHLFGKNRPSGFTPRQLENLSFCYSAVQDSLERRKAYPVAPIRSMPRRTYDPVQSRPMPQGRHVPMSLSRAYRENRNEWNRIKQRIDAFGVKSGLFREISVRQLGENTSDPFQLMVKVKNETVNLLDVGYGVSQILPIIVDTLTQSNAYMFLLQQPEVHLHPRGQAVLATFLLDRAEETGQSFIIETHSDQMIDRLRIEIRNRNLDPQTLSLLYFEDGENGVTIHEIDLDVQGNLRNVPASYRDFFLNEEYAILGHMR